MAGVSSQGLTFTFNSARYTVTSVSVDYGQERQRATALHMGLETNADEPVHYVPYKAFDSLPTLSIEYLAGTPPTVGQSAALSVAGPISFAGTATCISGQVTASIGDIVRGSASFRVRAQ